MFGDAVAAVGTSISCEVDRGLGLAASRPRRVSAREQCGRSGGGAESAAAQRRSGCAPYERPTPSSGARSRSGSRPWGGGDREPLAVLGSSSRDRASREHRVRSHFGVTPGVIPSAPGSAHIIATLALTPGTRLGVYEITAQIGEGGMGQVYRATDTKLKRQVAIKILPPSRRGRRRSARAFQREAEVLASLNHPNIAAIYGLEESGGMTALVMELVEGEDLSQRIARGAIPLDEALPIAKQIAEALEAAHEQGIIHRDLKPANIKVRADGTVKVLDFGLAKAMEPAGAIDARRRRSRRRSRRRR